MPPSSSSPAIVPSTLPSRVLSIPEVLLNIFSALRSPLSNPNEYEQLRNRNPSLARCARVCVAWRGPAETVLYSQLEIVWRFSEVEALTQCLNLNSAKYGLIKSCVIKEWSQEAFRASIYNEVAGQFLSAGYEFAEEGGYEEEPEWDRYMIGNEEDIEEEVEEKAKNHPDSVWLGVGSDRSEAAANSLRTFINRLTDLRRLSLLGLKRNVLNPQPNFSELSSLSRTLEHLETLTVEFAGIDIAQHILSLAPNLHSLELKNATIRLRIPSLKNLQHLTLNPVFSRHLRGLLTDCAASLQTLIVVPHDKFDLELPIPLISCTLLTHFHFYIRDHQKPKLLTSLLPFTPRLRYFSITLPGPLNSDLTLLTTLLPHFPQTLDFIKVCLGKKTISVHTDYTALPTFILNLPASLKGVEFLCSPDADINLIPQNRRASIEASEQILGVAIVGFQRALKLIKRRDVDVQIGQRGSGNDEQEGERLMAAWKRQKSS